jgi:outer membrane biosynthesis protein TonB
MMVEPAKPRRERDERGLPPMAVGGSLLLHAVVIALLVFASRSMAAPLPPPTYRVTLVAASAPKAPEREKPAPAKTAEKENRPPPPQPTTRRKPRVKAPTQTEKKPPTPPSKEPARSEKEGNEAVNVQLDGANTPYPAYFQNIIRQVYRYWRPPSNGKALRAEISFVIHRDGSVSDIEWVRRSGALGFDLEARGAVEAAGRARAFGALPKAYPGDRLSVSFFFDPTAY